MQIYRILIKKRVGDAHPPNYQWNYYVSFNKFIILIITKCTLCYLVNTGLYNSMKIVISVICNYYCIIK